MTTRRQRGALKAAKTRAINKSREEAAERKLRREEMDGNAAVLWDMMQTRRPLLRAQRAELDESVIRLCQARVRQRNLYSKERRLMTAHGVYWKYVTWIRTSAVLSPVSPRQVVKDVTYVNDVFAACVFCGFLLRGRPFSETKVSISFTPWLKADLAAHVNKCALVWAIKGRPMHFPTYLAHSDGVLP